MKRNIILLFFFLLCVTSAYAQNVAPLPPTQHDIAQQQQQEEFSRQLEVIAQAGTQFNNKMDEYNQRTEALEKQTSTQIMILAICLIIAVIGLIVFSLIISLRMIKKLRKELDYTDKELNLLRESTKDQMRVTREMAGLEVNNARQEIEKGRNEIETILAEVRQARNQCDRDMQDVENLRTKLEELTKEVEQLKADGISPAEKTETLEQRVQKLSDIIDSEDIILSAPIMEQLQQVVKETAAGKKEDEYTDRDWLLKGFEAYNAGNNSEACIYYEKAIKKNPLMAGAFNNWGIALSDDGLYKEAIEKYRKAIKINPNYALVYYNWSYTLSDMAGIDNNTALLAEAVEKAEKAVKFSPEYAMAYNAIGYSLLETAKINKSLKEDARRIAEKLVKADELGNIPASFNLACLYSLTDEKDKAFEWLEVALMRDENLTREDVEMDRDFADIYNDTRFRTLLDKYRPMPEAVEEPLPPATEDDKNTNNESGEKIMK